MVDPSEAEDQREGIAPGVETPAAASEAPRTLEQNGSGGGVTAEGEESSAEPEHHSELSSESIQQQSQPREQSPKLHLDLFNFDSPDAEGSRYVLTSPRSLEACARCSVKPVELLPRSLSDFAREAPGHSMRVATGLFEVYERDRHAKLKQCREERERIVREERRQIIQASVISKSSTTSSVERSPAAANTGSGLPSKTVLTGSSLPSKTILTGTDLPSKTALSGSSLPSKTILTGPVLPSKTVPTGSDFPSKTALTGSNHLPKTVLNGSNLLSRTAPASSVPTSKTALTGYGKRSKTIHIVAELKSPSAQPSTATSPLTCPTMTKSVSSGPAAKKVTPPIVKTHNTFPRSTSKPTSSVPRAHTSLTTAASNSSVQVTVANSAASCNGVRVVPFTHTNGYSGYKLKKQDKSPSLESLQRRREPTCSSTTTTTTTTCTSSESGASSSYSWDGQRDRWAKASSPRARTLATFNSLLGRSLSLGDLSHSPQTTQKVERIVKEVKRRGLKAVPERDRKIAALMLAKYQEEDIRSQTRYVAHLQWDSERRLEELRRECEDREKQRAVLQCQRAWQSQVSTRQQRLTQQEQETAATRLRHVAESEEKWREMAEQQERSRQQRLQQAAREGKQKKVLQEQNLRALEEERAAVLEQEQLLLQEKLTMAELKKQEREHQAQEERRGLNRAEKRRHAALRREIARREAEELELARKTMEEKLNRSSENYEQIVERRSQELREKARREERQIQKARRAAERRERQQQEQLEARTKEAERRAQQAALVAEERAREKSLRAGLSRQEKEKLQRINRQRVEEEEQQRRLELLQSIERKLEKSEQIFREKRAVLESARSVAQASFHMRDRVREETNMRTFDKMALEAKLKASLDEK